MYDDINEPGYTYEPPSYDPPEYLVDPEQGNQTDPYEGTYQQGGPGNQGYVSPDSTTFDPGGGGFDWTKILRQLGLMTGKDNSLLPLLAALGIGGNALMNRNATKKATNDVTGAVTTANDALAKMFAGQQGNFSPYTSAGANAASLAPGLAYKPVAGNFKPLGSGAALNLGNIMQRGR
jgi:hypothetical protein